mmetsp:Transcript_3126/g.4516  ORF Transcript_3126/g.4516 Transcript_3126/m.4516 type:complete len:258 (+) Transcript_3126:105-878(+)
MTTQPKTTKLDKRIDVQAIIFDLDGTLLDYEDASRVAMNKVVNRFDKEVDWKLHSKLLGRKMHNVAEILLKELKLENEFTPSSFVDTYYKEMDKIYKDIKPLPSVIETLQKLKETGVPMVIATSSYTDSYKKKMKFHTDIEKFVQLHVCGDDPEVKNGKPAPDIFLCAKHRLEQKIDRKLDPSKCLVFEDSPFGLQGAHAAGMMGIALPDKRIDHEIAGTDFSKATLVCSNGMTDFLDQFEKINIVGTEPSEKVKAE